MECRSIYKSKKAKQEAVQENAGDVERKMFGEVMRMIKSHDVWLAAPAFCLHLHKWLETSSRNPNMIILDYSTFHALNWKAQRTNMGDTRFPI